MKKNNSINRKYFTFRLSLLSACISAITSSIVLAGPEGGQVSGGSGSVSNSGNTTTIHQQTDRMAIDWQSYNVDVNERVQYIQPDSSSISLNRILSNSASQIQGRIDANGRVVLVNPQGIIFGKDSVVNAGGILASGLSTDTDQFMNGNFTFSEIEGTEGSVIASGVINAASGGSVALLGQSVKNEGLIKAELGSVSFAAGREAVVTFGENSFIGVRVSDALVKEQIGVDTAVLNEGEIHAAGGQVLLTGSASRDVFSGIINTGDMEFDRSVIVNDDGSYTFGDGVNVVNSGSINVSDEQGGSVVLLGENITHSGNINADSFITDQGGSVELYSADTTLLISDSHVSVEAVNGSGGGIKVLGDKVGLVQQASLSANGTIAGGQILIGGDERGDNTNVPNSAAVYVGDETVISANATEEGDGGKVILWGDDYLAAYGELNAVGADTGNGGFIETSSAVVNLNPTINVRGGLNGESGQWLIDPYNITIGVAAPQVPNAGSRDDFESVFTPSVDDSFISATTVRNALVGGSDVLIETVSAGGQHGDIIVNEAINYNDVGSSSLTLHADNNIDINQNIVDGGDDIIIDSLDLTLSANHNGNAQPDGGNINIASGVTIATEGGMFTATGVNFENLGTINVRFNDGGGDIDLDMSGNVTELGQIVFGDSNSDGTASKSIAVTANNITTTGNISYGVNGSSADHITNVIFNAAENITFDGGGIDNANGANIANITLNADTNTSDGLDGNVSILNNTSLWLTGGDFIATGHDFTINGGGADLTNVGTEGGLFSVGTESNPLTGSFNTNFTDSEVTTYINQGGSINRTGNFSIYANGNIDLGRTTAVDAGGTTRTWDYTGSDAVSIILDADGNVTLHEALAIDRFTGTGSSTLDINAGGALTIDAEIVHSSDQSIFTFGAGTGGFINNAAIDSNGLNIGINSVADSNTAGVSFADDISAQNLFVTTSGGDITDINTAVLVVNNITLSAGTGDITLDNSGLSIGNRISATSGNSLTVVENDEIRILNTTLIGNLNLTATGDNGIFDDGPIVVGGTTTLLAEDNLIELTNNVSSDFTGAVSATGSRFEISDINDLVLGNILTTDGAANNTITAQGAITQTSGAISTSGGSLSVTGADVQVNAVTTQNGVINITANDGTPLITLAGNIDSGNANITLTGDVELATTIEIDTVAGGDAGQLTVTGNITADDDANAESFTIDAGIVVLNDVSTAAIQTGESGGSVNISGSQITIGAINTSGRDAANLLMDNGGNGGAVDLSVDTNSASIFTLNGDINTQGGLGLLAGTNGPANITLENGASSGLVDLSNAGIFTSSVTITGSNSGSDVLIGPDDAVNTVNWQSSASGGSFGNSTVSDGVATFTGFETVTGGSGADIFTIAHESVGTWNGGEGDDEFNMAAGIDTDIHGNISGVDDANDNTVNLITETGDHDWTITGVGDGTLTGGFSFFLFDTLNGSDGGDDRFQVNSSFGDGNTINARGQTLGDSLLVSAAGTQTIGFGDVQGGIGGIEAIEAVGDADDFIVQLAEGSTNNRWDMTDPNRGTITNTDTLDDISFINFATVVGNSGNDVFNIDASGSIERIDGGTGTNAVDFSAQTINVNISIDESLGDIDTSTTRLANIQAITAPASTINTLNVNSASSSEYTWRFFDFDADAVGGVDGVGDGQLFEDDNITPTLSFIDFDIFNGGDGTDNFVIEQRANNITVNGRGGNADSIESTVAALTNRWGIDEADGGDLIVTDALGNTTIAFSEIENIVGANDVADTFVFTDPGSISGAVNAGEADGIIDTVDYSFSSGDRDVVVDSTIDGIVNIERVIGNASTDNSLTGSSEFFRFDITGDLSGEVFNDGRSDSLVFENFGELIGSGVDDVFTVSAAGFTELIRAGGGSNNQLISSGVASNWYIDDLANDVSARRITSQADGSDRVASFNAIQTLQGADEFADTFTLIADSNFNGTVVGGTSVAVDGIRDELNVESTAATNVDWDLLNSGYSVTRNDTQTLEFLGIENIVGGAGNDTFAIDDSFVDSSISIDGSQTTDRDVLDVSRLADNTDVLLLNVISTNNAIALDRNSTRVTQVNNVEAVRGALQSNVTFQSLFENTWNIQSISTSDGNTDGINDGQLTAVIGASNRNIDFENIGALRGGDSADTFVIADGAEFNGALNADGGINVLTNNNSGLTWQLTDAFSGSVAGTTFFDIQTLNANDSVLVGRAQNNVWNVTSANGGTVAIDDDMGSDQIVFTGMSSLYGNSGDDDFIMATTGSITGDILGTLLGTSDTTNDRLEIVSNAGDDVSWTINNTSSADRVNSFSSIENLMGGDGDDSFNIVNIPFALTMDGGANSPVVDASLAGDIVLWNVNDIGANVYLSDSEQRIRRNDGSTTSIELTDIEVVAGSNNNANTDSFQILGGTVAQARGRNGADTFTIDNSEKEDINIRIYGGGAAGIFNNVLIGADRDNTWRFVGTDSTDDTLNYIDEDNNGIIFNDAFLTFIGGNFNDNFIVIDGNEIPSIDGLVGNIDSVNTLEIQSAASDGGQITWNITDDNGGNVTGRVGSFSNIQNVTGGEGTDVFNISGGNVDGLIDGRDNTLPDAVEDTLNVGSLTEVVVVVGEDGNAMPLVAGAEDSPYINVTGIENILADDLAAEVNENNRWIVVNSDRSISWSFNNFNSGTVVELAGPLDAPTLEGLPLDNSEFFFDNFGSAQGGVGADTIDNPDGLTGIFNPSGGGQNLIYGANVDLAVAFITPDILSVVGTNGNVILRIAPDDVIEDANFNGDNAWTIDAENSGNFLADYFDNGEDDTGFSFNFSGVNRIEGGSGGDLFTFTGTGVLTDGYINGGAGDNRIVLTSAHSLGVDFGVSTLNSDATDLNNGDLNIVVFPAVNPDPLPELFELDNRTGVIDVLNISSIDAASSLSRSDALRLRSAESGNFTWRFDDQLLDTDNNIALSYSGFDDIQGGGANDRFELPSDLVLPNQLDGGDGQDTVDLSAFAEVTVDLDIVAGAYLNMEAYEGNNSNSEFLAADGLNVWAVNGINQGTVINGGETTRFSGFNVIQGGEGRDEITIEQGGINGDIFGNGGNDQLNVALGFTEDAPAIGGASVDINFVGGEGVNELIVTGGSDANRFVGDYTPGSIINPTQQRFDYAYAQEGASQNTSITLNQVDEFVEQVFTSVMTLNDVNAQADTIRVSNASFEVDGFSVIASSNNASLNIEGETTDAVLIEGNITLANEFSVTNASVMTQDESFVINAGSGIRFNGNAGIGSTDSPASGPLNIESPNVFLNAIQGDTFLSSSGDINIAQLNSPSGIVDILSTGSITDSAVLNSLNDVRLRSDENIILDNQNTLTGVLQLSAQDITLNNSVTRLGDTSAENLTITARGGVQDEGTLNISDTTTINAQENSAIILDTIDNQFNVVAVNNAASLELVDTSANGVTISGDVADSFAINANSNVVANALDANAIALISESGNVVTQDTLNATSQVRLMGNDVTVNSVIDVTGSNTLAVDITATDAVQLNANVLANIASGDVTISSNTLTQNAGANLRGRNITVSTTGAQNLNANLTASDTVSSTSGVSLTMTGGVFDNSIDARVINLNAQDSIVLQNVSANEIVIASDLGDINQQGNITTNTIDIDALNGIFTSDTNTTLTLNEGVSTLDAQDASLNGDILGNGTFVINLANQFTQNGGITVESFELNAGDVLMDTNAQINSVNDVLINTQQDIQLGQINSDTTVSLLAGGAISDNNGALTNVSATSLVSRSEEGFGAPSVTGNLIETAVANIDVQNNMNGIGLFNSGDVSVTSIISNSDIYFQNNDGNVILANADSGSYDRTTSDAREAGGVINSNYNFGVTTINIPNGFLDATPAPFVERPELVGDIVDVTTSGGFGVSRRLVVYARTEAIIGGRGIQPFFGFNTPPEFGLTTDTDLLSLANVSSAAELLVEVEDLQDVDPAVFTNIRNFAFDDVSIRMPRDQVYDDGVYEDDERESDYDY